MRRTDPRLAPVVGALLALVASGSLVASALISERLPLQAGPQHDVEAISRRGGGAAAPLVVPGITPTTGAGDAVPVVGAETLAAGDPSTAPAASGPPAVVTGSLGTNLVLGKTVGVASRSGAATRGDTDTATDDRHRSTRGKGHGSDTPGHTKDDDGRGRSSKDDGARHRGRGGKDRDTGRDRDRGRDNDRGKEGQKRAAGRDDGGDVKDDDDEASHSASRSRRASGSNGHEGERRNHRGNKGGRKKG